MKWKEFLKKTAALSIIDTEMLLAGVANQVPIKVQISRWHKQGKLIQLKRGLYLVAEPYRKREIHGFCIASALKRPSYISVEKAMEYYDLIPEAVRVYTSVTTKSPSSIKTEVGTFDYAHIKKELFWGYKSVVEGRHAAFVALPEKALLDFFYLKAKAGIKASPAYIDELRLQNLEGINLKKLMLYAKRFAKPGIYRTAAMLKRYIAAERAKEKTL